MAEKSKRKTFVALTIMGLAAAIGILNKDTLAHMGPLAMGLGVLCLVVVIVLYFVKTRAGQKTGQEYADGAKETAKEAKEALDKAGDKAEDLFRKGKDLINRG